MSSAEMGGGPGMGSEMSGGDPGMGDGMFERVVSNEVETPLEGEELDRVRYSELSEELRDNPNTNKKKITFQWKGTRDKGFNENEDLMVANMTLLEDGTLELRAADWQASISPDGKISGNMPPKLLDFLTYYKRESDVSYGKNTEHQVDYIKKGFGAGGQSISTSPTIE